MQSLISTVVWLFIYLGAPSLFSVYDRILNVPFVWSPANEYRTQLDKELAKPAPGMEGLPNSFADYVEHCQKLHVALTQVHDDWESKPRPASWPADFDWPGMLIEWRDDDSAEIRLAQSQFLAAIEANGGTRGLDGLTGHERVNFEPERGSVVMLSKTPWIGTTRAYARMQAARARHAALAKDWPTFVEAIRRGLAVSSANQQHAEFKPAWVGFVQRSLFEQVLLDLAVLPHDQRPPLGVWSEVQNLLNQSPDRIDVARVLEVERLSMLEITRARFAQIGPGGPMLMKIGSFGENSTALRASISGTPRERLGKLLGNVFARFFVSAHASESLIDSAMRDLVLARDDVSRGAWARRIDKRLFGPDRRLAEVAAGIVLPATEKQPPMIESAGRRRDAAIVAIAIAAHIQERGSLPSSVDQLVPKYVPELPVSIQNGTLRYLVTGQPKERRAILYSIGRDGVDNSGRKEAEAFGDLNTRSGFDFVYAEWNETQ